jgi:hypothetical protein
MKNTTKQATISPGDRFYTSWGYDQTNIDYLLVTSISPTGKTAKCRMVSPINIGASGVCDALTPGQAYGETFIMQIRGNTLRGSYPYCRGDKRLATFYKTQLGDTHYQTNPLFGH